MRIPRRPLMIAVLSTIGLLAVGCGTQPAQSAPGEGGRVTIVLTGDGCQPTPNALPAGAVNFSVSNKDAGGVTEAELLSNGRILAEQENLAPGLDGGFSLHLDQGEYQIYCPGAKQDRWKFSVSGQAAKSWQDNPDLVKATDDYAHWTTDQVTQLVSHTQAFTAAVRAGDLSQAQVLYGQARVYYERVEPVAEIWGDLDKSIDGRADDFANPNDFSGFHKLEEAIWEKKTLAGMTQTADELDKNVQQLNQLVSKATYQPAEIANGAKELLDEIQKTKVTGEEERYSHIDLTDFQANLDGSLEAFTVLLPALRTIDPALVSNVQQRIQLVKQALAPYQQNPGYFNTGFVDYATVSADQRRALSQTINALGEVMSTVAAKVA